MSIFRVLSNTNWCHWRSIGLAQFAGPSTTCSHIHGFAISTVRLRCFSESRSKKPCPWKLWDGIFFPTVENSWQFHQGFTRGRKVCHDPQTRDITRPLTQIVCGYIGMIPESQFLSVHIDRRKGNNQRLAGKKSFLRVKNQNRFSSGCGFLRKKTSVSTFIKKYKIRYCSPCGHLRCEHLHNCGDQHAFNLFNQFSKY